jgi:hypothetical protein
MHLLSDRALEIPFEYSVPEERIRIFALDKDKFFHATEFFSREYNRVGRNVDDLVWPEPRSRHLSLLPGN